jgi:hypothetical protein
MHSRLRKKGPRELDAAQIRDFVSQGKVLVAPAGVPRIHFRTCEHTATSAYVACIARFLIRTKL